MKRGRIFLLFFLVLLVAYFLLTCAIAQVPVGGVNIIRISGKTIVDEKGNLHVNLEWKIPTDALYAQIKRNYPNPYMILREFLPQRATREVANAKTEYNDTKTSLQLTIDFLGASVNKKGRWEIYMGKGVECIWVENQKATFFQIISLDSQTIEVMDLVVSLPQEASSIMYEAEKGLLTYSLPEKPATGSCDLRLSMKCKPRIMAATYKLYGKPQSFEESMWVAKTLFRNIGECNIRNLKVSYKLGEYSDWSAPKSYSLIVPGGYVVDLYYPVISSKVTELMTRSPVDLKVNYTYEDGKGNSYSDVTAEIIEILGINQIEFSNLTVEEKTGAWADNFSNVPLLAAWVTHLDSPVKALAGMVSQLAGGVPTALDRESAIKFCRALYDLEVTNGVAYQTPSGFLLQYSSGQDIKYPRDILRDKSGTCVDLAILYASVCEAVGLETLLVVVPGHSFPAVILPGGEILPVESTAISGPKGAAPFDKAVEIGLKQLSQLRVGMYYMVDVEAMRKQGVVSPELPKLEADILKRWGWRFPRRRVTSLPQSSRAERIPYQDVSGTCL